MKRVTIRVPATTANLGPGFDAFGCALSLYTDVTFEETDEPGLTITGCDEAYTGPDNLAYTSYCAVLASLSEEVRGVKIHIDAHIPICRGLGSSAALLVAGAMGANVLRGSRLSTQGLLNITNAMEGHPDNLAPATSRAAEEPSPRQMGIWASMWIFTPRISSLREASTAQ